MNREKNSGIVFIKSPGLGDLQILLSNIHHISKKIDRPLAVLAQPTTGAAAVFQKDHHVNEVLDLGKKDLRAAIHQKGDIVHQQVIITIYVQV